VRRSAEESQGDGEGCADWRREAAVLGLGLHAITVCGGAVAAERWCGGAVAELFGGVVAERGCGGSGVRVRYGRWMERGGVKGMDLTNEAH
jgi:hypothetical protein